MKKRMALLSRRLITRQTVGVLSTIRFMEAPPIRRLPNGLKRVPMTIY